MKEETPEPRRSRRARWGRRLLVAAAVFIGALAALWIAIHHVPGFGPWLADTGRSVLGVEAVARIESFAYGVEDRVLRITRGREPPKVAWKLPPPPPSAAPSDAGTDAPPRPPPWHPADVGPVRERHSTPVDGVWVAVPDPRRPDAPSLLFKTVLHPDRKRSWATLYVVAMRVASIELHLVTGTVDPRPSTREGHEAKRPGLIDARDFPTLVAAFNGGFKTVHGHYGLKTAGVTFVPPRSISCTIFGYEDGTLGVAPWKAVSDSEPRMRFWRGTPPCLVEAGKRHPSLWDPETTGWGAALDGETVIRRSALGISAKRDVIYVGLGDYVTAGALADGMGHVGADTVAQLDVNFSFPKLVLFKEPTRGTLEAESLFEGFAADEDDYVRKPSPRDFFYVTRRE